MSFTNKLTAGLALIALSVSSFIYAEDKSIDKAALKQLVEQSKKDAAKLTAENPQLNKLVSESRAKAKVIAEDKELIKQTQSSLTDSESHRAAAYKILNNIELDAQFPGAEQSPLQPQAQPIDSSILVFASFSLGEKGLKAMAEAVSRYPNATIVFRGLVNEDSYVDSLRKMQGISQKDKIIPNIALDPTLFKKYNITTVPTMVYRDIDNDTELARVSGLHNPQYLIDKVKAGKHGDFGVQADISKIIERDLIEVLKQRMAAIDWEAQKEGAIKRFWEKQTFLVKPAATKTYTRTLDPTVIVQKDITDAYGRVIQPAGARINPLETVIFDKALVIFNPNDNRQLAVVDKELVKLKAKYSDITYIVTELERDKAWEQMQSLADHFDEPIYKLMQDIDQRFMIENVPTIITADRKVFYIKELEVTDDTKGDKNANK